jgi:hypothetical protein
MLGDLLARVHEEEKALDHYSIALKWVHQSIAVNSVMLSNSVVLKPSALKPTFTSCPQPASPHHITRPCFHKIILLTSSYLHLSLPDGLFCNWPN